MEVKEGFSETCKEVTQLYDAANVFMKTINVARNALIQGNDNKALLNYN